MPEENFIHNVSLSISDVKNLSDIHNWANQILNYLSKYVISDITATTSELSFDLTTKDKQPVASIEVGSEIKTYADLNKPPFQIVRGNVIEKVVGDDMWSWS